MAVSNRWFGIFGEALIIDDISSVPTLRLLHNLGAKVGRARGSFGNRRGEAERLRLRYVRPPCFSNHIQARIMQKNSEEREDLRVVVLEFARYQDPCKHGERGIWGEYPALDGSTLLHTPAT